MKYLAKYNEEINWFKKVRKKVTGPTKEDMYISEKFPGPTVADITPDRLMSGKQVPDVSLDLIKDYYIKDISNKGVFVHTPEDYSHKQYKFKSTFNDSTEVWYNQSYLFKRLRETSNKLGYKIGTHVDIDRGGSGVIDEIVNFAFYEVGSHCHEVLTLLYKVDSFEIDKETGLSQSVPTYYQITQIEKSEVPADNIVDEVIKENFYDLIDENIISYSSVDKGTIFDCKIVIHSFSMNRLHQVTEHLSVAESRLKDSNISLQIDDISKSNGEYVITFKCVKLKNLSVRK